MRLHFQALDQLHHEDGEVRQFCQALVLELVACILVLVLLALLILFSDVVLELLDLYSALILLRRNRTLHIRYLLLQRVNPLILILSILLHFSLLALPLHLELLELSDIVLEFDLVGLAHLHQIHQVLIFGIELQLKLSDLFTKYLWVVLAVVQVKPRVVDGQERDRLASLGKLES